MDIKILSKFKFWHKLFFKLETHFYIYKVLRAFFSRFEKINIEFCIYIINNSLKANWKVYSMKFSKILIVSCLIFKYNIYIY